MTFPERWIKEIKSPSTCPWHSRVHVIKSLTYRQATSWAGFFSYKHNRNKIDGFNHFFMSWGADDLEVQQISQGFMRERGIEVEYTYEWIYHEDLYAFYDYIGYNRHTKKFERS